MKKLFAPFVFVFTGFNNTIITFILSSQKQNVIQIVFDNAYVKLVN